MSNESSDQTPSWSEWRPFPDPRKGDLLIAPFGPGVYELRDRRTEEWVLRGMGSNCAHRMTSLLPPPLGQGTRNNNTKRDYVLEHLPFIDYRYAICQTPDAARALESRRKATCPCRFNT